MLFPECPRCGNRLPISPFFIRPKEKREAKYIDVLPELECNKCMAVIRVNPKIYLLLSTVSIIAVIVLLAGISSGKFAFTDPLILIVILVGCISIPLSWRFLEVMDGRKQDK